MYHFTKSYVKHVYMQIVHRGVRIVFAGGVSVTLHHHCILRQMLYENIK